MNTKRVLFGMLACAVLMLASCTNESASEDELFEQSIERNKVKTSN